MRHAAEPARPHDLREALDLLRRADLPETGVAEEFGHYLVVRDDGQVAGVCGLEVHGREGLLRSLAVDPTHRGHGLGALLVEGTVALAARIGLTDVYLLTTTARDYFIRNGFTDCPRDAAPAGIQESWEFREGCPSSSAFLRRTIRASR